MAEILKRLCDIVWGIPMIGLILLTGLVFTVRLRGVQLRCLGKGLRYAFCSETSGAGEISPFAALCTALAATIGTGNIVGVATAICAGGPGALFWMLVAAVLGMATQYAEGFLAIRYRAADETGHICGGPFAYMERGLGPRWRGAAKFFAGCAVFAGVFGVGTLAQVSGISAAVEAFFTPDFDGRAGLWILGAYRSGAVVAAGIIVTVAAALVLAGGAQRIARAAEAVVPFMAVGYVVITGLLLLRNASAIPAALGEIIRGAFCPSAVTGGAIGSVIVTAQKGIARGIFTNEAGMGTAAIAAATAKTDSPVRQGMVAMTGTFIDTVILCTMTGLSIVLTGAWRDGGEGAAVTGLAFVRGLPFSADLARFLLMASLVFFAFATILGWHFYAQRCLAYLTGNNAAAAIAYRWVCILVVLAAPYCSSDVVWVLADLSNGLMAFPNLAALLVLAPRVTCDLQQKARSSV